MAGGWRGLGKSAGRRLGAIRAAVSRPRIARAVLTAAQCRAFRRDGYVAVRIPVDPAQIAAAIDLTWTRIDPRLRRDDPSSWQGSVTDCCFTRDLNARRGRVKIKEAVENEPLLRAMLRENPFVLAMVRQLLGPDARARRYQRGLYPTFPQPRDLSGPSNLDGHPFQIGAILYLTDVPFDGGAFSVWPGTHIAMRDAFDSDHEWAWGPRYAAFRQSAQRSARQRRLPGRAGTLILWHYRLLHRPTVNLRPTVRHALLQDFLHADFEARRGSPKATDPWAGWAR